MRILGFLKTRWQDSISSLDSAVDQMKEESREVITDLAGQIQTKMDAARETLAAIEQATAETAAQKQLTEALEERVAESNRAIEARKKLYQTLRAQLASDDADEQLAAFQSIFVSDQHELSKQERQDLLAIVLQSEDPALQGAALFQIFARKHELPMKRVQRTEGENGTAPVEDYILSFKVKRLSTNYRFDADLKFNRKRKRLVCIRNHSWRSIDIEGGKWLQSSTKPLYLERIRGRRWRIAGGTGVLRNRLQ